MDRLSKKSAGAIFRIRHTDEVLQQVTDNQARKATDLVCAQRPRHQSRTEETKSACVATCNTPLYYTTSLYCSVEENAEWSSKRIGTCTDIICGIARGSLCAETVFCLSATQSDYHTHVHDLPPQIGGCLASGTPEQVAAAASIDGTDGA